MKLEYRIIAVDLSQGHHRDAAIVPGATTGKLPVIVDRAPEDDGVPITLFESGAILQYLAEKTGSFLSRDLRQRMVTMQWLFWQMAGLGPIGGQAGHFHLYAPKIAPSADIAYPTNRYFKMWASLWKVLEPQLAKSEFIAGEYSIADMACFPWISYLTPREGVEKFPNVCRWRDGVAARSAVQTAYRRAKEADTGYGQNENGVTMFPWDGIVKNVITV
jgi:GST-like protein